MSTLPIYIDLDTLGVSGMAHYRRLVHEPSSAVENMRLPRRSETIEARSKLLVTSQMGLALC